MKLIYLPSCSKIFLLCASSHEKTRDANDESSGGGLLTSCWSCFKEHVSRSNSLLE